MDDSPPLDCKYAERVAMQNNMDIVADNVPPSAGLQKYDFAMPPSLTPHAPHEDTPNDLSPTDNFNTSPEPSLPTVISYSTNALADPNLWDGNFTATSLQTQTNSCKAMSATWLAHYNVWHASSNSKA